MSLKKPPVDLMERANRMADMMAKDIVALVQKQAKNPPLVEASWPENPDHVAIKGELRVWWISNLGTKPVYFYVNSIEAAKVVLKVLEVHDLYLGELVRSNAGGLEVLEETDEGLEWVDWYDEEGRCINDPMEEES